MTVLPQLLDCKGVMRELGVTRGVAEAFMRRCEKVVVGRRVFVKRDELLRVVDAATVTVDGFPKGQAA